ncbi:hypothetical protein [Luteimonas sp. MC1895]|uniref:hypothetical protein n=1 Tax=Luteimonas sp. MC1895 TaxID=2819513 RepID=UPI0018F0CF5B|nr:hypothetical protein [Luteimonas sp. MC1895]MBJ6980230.1 hypothetical protein [Luteimonas sp. MC1895]
MTALLALLNARTLLLYSLAGPPMTVLAWLCLVGPPMLGDTWRPPGGLLLWLTTVTYGLMFIPAFIVGVLVSLLQHLPRVAASPWLQVAVGMSAGSAVGFAYAWDPRPALDGSAGLGLVGASAAGMCALAQVGWDGACRYSEASAAARERSRGM